MFLPIQNATAAAGPLENRTMAAKKDPKYIYTVRLRSRDGSGERVVTVNGNNAFVDHRGTLTVAELCDSYGQGKISAAFAGGIWIDMVRSDYAGVK